MDLVQATEAESRRASHTCTDTHGCPPRRTRPQGSARCFDVGRHTREDWLTPPWSRRHQLHAWDIPIIRCKAASPARPSALYCHSPWRSGLQSIPGGLSQPIWLGICCQHGRASPHCTPAVGCDSFTLAPARPLAAVWATQRPLGGLVDGLAITVSLLGLPVLSWPKQMIPGPGEQGLTSRTLEKHNGLGQA